MIGWFGDSGHPQETHLFCSYLGCLGGARVKTLAQTQRCTMNHGVWLGTGGLFSCSAQPPKQAADWLLKCGACENWWMILDGIEWYWMVHVWNRVAWRRVWVYLALLNIRHLHTNGMLPDNLLMMLEKIFTGDSATTWGGDVAFSHRGLAALPKRDSAFVEVFYEPSYALNRRNDDHDLNTTVMTTWIGKIL